MRIEFKQRIVHPDNRQEEKILQAEVLDHFVASPNDNSSARRAMLLVHGEDGLLYEVMAHGVKVISV